VLGQGQKNTWAVMTEKHWKQTEGGGGDEKIGGDMAGAKLGSIFLLYSKSPRRNNVRVTNLRMINFFLWFIHCFFCFCGCGWCFVVAVQQLYNRLKFKTLTGKNQCLGPPNLWGQHFLHSFLCDQTIRAAKILTYKNVFVFNTQ